MHVKSHKQVEMMETKDYLRVLVDEIHSVVVATTDANGLPSTRVIDIMLHDDKGIYFLTAKGKLFYEQLMDKSYVSLSGMTSGGNTLAKKAISISGAVHNIGIEKRAEIFEKNRYMAKIYASEESREALEVFCLYKGKGEFFDLSTKPITRGSFAIGEGTIETFAYYITDKCVACGKCITSCPSNCITIANPYKINVSHCLYCGNCHSICPENAVIKP